MAGRRIRWRSAARIAGIAFAAIGAIAAIPALMGSDAPPPVPADVGLIPTQTAVSPPPPPAAPEPPVASPRVKNKARNRTDAKQERGANRHRKPKKEGGANGHRKPPRRQRGETDGPDPPPLPAPVQNYAPRPILPEFGIEP
jgi:hypothetical protein